MILTSKLEKVARPSIIIGYALLEIGEVRIVTWLLESTAHLSIL